MGVNGLDRYSIVSDITPFVNDPVTKVGRTTGRTSGTVTNTCTTYNVANSDVTMLCQAKGDYVSQGGDSGAAVFTIGSSGNVDLRGLHWGSGGVFSPVGNVQRTDELGVLGDCVTTNC